MMTNPVLFLLVLTLLSSAAPGAGVVNIDFQVGTGRGVMVGGGGTVILSPGPFWNVNGEDGVAVPLLTSIGAPTGLSLVTSFYFGQTTVDADAMFGDYVAGTASIIGLNPGQEYRLVVYGGANLQNVFRVEQPFDTSSPGYGEIDCDYRHTALPGVHGCDYVTGEAVADEFGVITVAVSPGAMAGMQIVPNPEPSVLFLQGIGGLLLALRRRRF
jgi:hypothetical protein